jgi:hypothetical protein
MLRDSTMRNGVGDACNDEGDEEGEGAAASRCEGGGNEASGVQASESGRLSSGSSASRTPRPPSSCASTAAAGAANTFAPMLDRCHEVARALFRDERKPVNADTATIEKSFDTATESSATSVSTPVELMLIRFRSVEF